MSRRTDNRPLNKMTAKNVDMARHVQCVLAREGVRVVLLRDSSCRTSVSMCDLLCKRFRSVTKTRSKRAQLQNLKKVPGKQAGVYALACGFEVDCSSFRSL